MKYWDKYCDLTEGFSMGLCFWFKESKHFGLVTPTEEEKDKLSFDGKPSVYWGRETFNEGGFTPLRQNLVLLMAAMNNEL